MIKINPKSKKSISEQIVFSVQESILNQMFSPHEKLPSVRELSTTLTINPNTVAKAYLRLEQLGIIYTLKGKGSFVCETNKILPSNLLYKNISDKLYEIIVESIGFGVSIDEIHKIIDNLYNEKIKQTNALKVGELHD